MNSGRASLDTAHAEAGGSKGKTSPDFYGRFEERKEYLRQDRQVCPAPMNMLYESNNILSALRKQATYRDGKADLLYRYRYVEPEESVDWRKAGIVGPIKNQHVNGSQCGCCWSFATIGVVESINALATGKMDVLSEQQLIACDKKGVVAATRLSSGIEFYDRTNFHCRRSCE